MAAQGAPATRGRVLRLAFVALLGALAMAAGSSMLARHWPWWRALAPGGPDLAVGQMDAEAAPDARPGGTAMQAAGPAGPPMPAAQAAGPVDIGFAQDMSLHHEQALTMARLALAHGTPRVRPLAEGIVNQQLKEIGAMQGWLMLWDAPATSATDDMRWMRDAYEASRRHDPVYEQYIESCARGEGMPGMATVDDMEGLSALRDAAFDTRFLALMVRHHQGAAVMARFAAEHARAEPVRTFARTIAAEQRRETIQMATLLAMLRRPGIARR